MSKQQNKPVDPVIIVMLGIVFVAIAVAIFVFQPSSNSISIAADASVMSQLMVAFVTGITTGGLSCLAVQGGLLASSLAHQIEQDYVERSVQSKKREKKTKQLQPINASPNFSSFLIRFIIRFVIYGSLMIVSIWIFGLNSQKYAMPIIIGVAAMIDVLRAYLPQSRLALPILLFLIAKLVAYTLLGALLGWLGSYLTLSPMTRAMLMIFIGIFMIGNALRMFNVHPIFRYFSIEPPKFITRYIRRTAKGTDTATPILLGALTVFIPCGVTQAMMATALGTGSAAMGAALMFAFILGTSPVFFIVAYLATELGSKLEKFFMRFVAVVVLILGFVTLNGGLNVLGSPLSFENITRNFFPSTSRSAPVVESSQQPAREGEIVLNVQNGGYFPATLSAPADKDFTLNLVTNQTYSCARDFVIPALNYYQLLPGTGTVQVNIPAQPKGSRLFFTCSMGMYTGQILFE